MRPPAAAPGGSPGARITAPSTSSAGTWPPTTCNAGDAELAVRLAITEAERLAGGVPLVEQLTDPDTGKIRRIKLVTDNGGAFKGARFAAFIASRPELLHIRTRRRSPGQNGVRERAFGSLKYEHLYRHEITDGQSLAVETERYRQVFNHIRPHEGLDIRRPSEVHTQNEQAQHSLEETEPGS